MISAARESESLLNDIFILAIVLKGISGQVGVTVGANVWSGSDADKDSKVAPADTAITPMTAVVAT